MPTFSWRLRVYWEDTDAGGVVYHASYLRFLERARTEWLRARGLGQTELREGLGVLFVVREIDVAFDKPARLDDELDATVQVAQRRSASLELQQTLRRVPNGETLTRARVRVACIDASTWQPRRIPEQVAALIEGSSELAS
ncbi:MAG TPA: tol-pal system-associated acyl-CoA thioesterase [Rhodanobacteraceae bacterium]|nr:tol-pal system-associated acyl-CoA thioesterase [Rhodanobacteraceae bacterium]